MSYLEAVKTGKKHRPRRVMVYGVGGTGKSTFGASCPRPIFLDLERGIGDIDTSSIDGLDSFESVEAALTELATSNHDFKTVVVDSLDVLESLVWEHVCRLARVDTLEDIPYGKGYVVAVEKWRELLSKLEDCQTAGMMIVLIGHAQVTTFNDPAHESYSRYVPRLDRRATGLIVDWCDECLFTTFRVFTQQQDEKFGTVKHRGTSDGSRVFKCEERPSHVAKNRLGMPPEIDLSWNSYMEFAYPQGQKKEEVSV